MHYPLANHTKLQHWSLAWLPVHISNTKRKMQLLAWTLNVLVQTFGTKTTPPMHIRLKKNHFINNSTFLRLLAAGVGQHIPLHSPGQDRMSFRKMEYGMLPFCVAFSQSYRLYVQEYVLMCICIREQHPQRKSKRSFVHNGQWDVTL